MNFNLGKIFQSKFFGGIVLGIAGILVLSLVFKGGMIVGAKKADFSCRWNNNYHANFAGPREGFGKGFADRDFIDANGTIGQIIKIDGQTLTINGRDNVEKIILVKEDTAIKSVRETLKIADLKIDDLVVVIGEPNETGQISAKLIRLMPAMGAAQPMPVPTSPAEIDGRPLPPAPQGVRR